MVLVDGVVGVGRVRGSAKEEAHGLRHWVARPGTPDPSQIGGGGCRQGVLSKDRPNGSGGFRNLLFLLQPLRLNSDWENVKGQIEEARGVNRQ